MAISKPAPLSEVLFGHPTAATITRDAGLPAALSAWYWAARANTARCDERMHPQRSSPDTLKPSLHWRERL